MPKRPRYRPLRRVDALMAFMLGVAGFFVASRLYVVTDTTVQPWPHLWPALFFASGVTCLWFGWCALETGCRFINSALAWSGAITVTSYASRAVILFLSHTSRQPARQQVAVSVWLMLALVTGYVWLHVFRPAVEMSKRRDT